MKRSGWISILLAFTLLLSIVLTFTSINIHDLYTFITNRDGDEAQTVETLPEEATIAEYDITDFYESTDLELKDVIRPSGYYYHEDQSFYWLNQEDIQQTITAYFSSLPMMVENPDNILETDNFSNLFEEDYLEINFREALPVGLISNYTGVDDLSESSFLMNQIVIPFDDNQTVYLMNSETGEYLEAQMTEQLTKEELKEVISKNTDNAIPVRRYYGQHHFIYLPTEQLTRDSRLYTLEELPENLFISQMFSGDLEPKIVSTSNTSSIYRNYRYSLEINNATKRLDFMISRIDDGNTSTTLEGIEDSFAVIKKYEYWPGDIRLSNRTNGRITYRHYLDNMPIFTVPNLPDYGASTVHLRNDSSQDVYRFQTALLIPQAFINDVSQQYTLASDGEVLTELSELGLQISEFDAVSIGYEWQTDMEDFQKAILVPKWFFYYDDQAYAIDQLDSEAFMKHREEVINEMRGG
ncbi:hypothetical protein HZY86_00730 [Aerococcaceae bacterium DSM 111020]|nr:hypothetical protein [Aerococcaceae bacterium DSM 111020]